MLVAHLTPLIGREQDVETLKAWVLDPAIHLMTLKGFGGMGMTRLALKVVKGVLPEFSCGAAFLPLASVHNTELALPTVVKFLGLEDRQEQPLEVLEHALHEQQVLLICDNCEQVADATPALASLLTLCPRLKLLFTSRKSLPLRAGRISILDALALPPLLLVPAPIQWPPTRSPLWRCILSAPEKKSTPSNSPRKMSLL